MLDAYSNIRGLIVSTAISTWRITKAVCDRALIPEETDRAFVVRGEISRPFTGARNVTETYSFTIGLRLALPQDEDIDLLRLGKCKSMGEALLAADWASIGAYYPRVESIPAPDYEEIGDAYYDSVLGFSIDSDVTQ
jgi:hypothetical protein